MLSTLAKYIFGGIMGDAPETIPMQYETREVNDWLLVDMPDQAIDNEDLDSESEEDEILTAVPLLMTEEVAKQPANIVLTYDDDDDDDSICDTSYAEIHTPEEQSCVSDSYLWDIGVYTNPDHIYEQTVDFQILPECWYMNESWYYPSDFSLAISHCYNGHQCITAHNSEISIFRKAIPNELKQKKNTMAIKIAPLSILTDKRINHPAAFSKNFINHKSPVLSPKTALLEQVKDLKPIQRAIEYEAKKYLTRSQLNRQNRNYIYQSSVKTNRRRNLQRNHSGANNNRKC